MRRALVVSLISIAFATACANEVLYVEEAVPSAPRALVASYYAGSVTLTWEMGPSWNGEAFRVYSRRVTDSRWFFIAEVTSCIDDACVYEDINVAGGQRYEYFVAAVAPGGTEAASATVEIAVPEPIAPPIPDAFRAIALDDANYLAWGGAARAVPDFSHYRVYFQDGASSLLLGETDSEGFLDLLAENGGTYAYYVTSMDTQGHESPGSFVAEATPRPDFSGEYLYDWFVTPERSGFRFQEDEEALPVVAGDDPRRHFRLETDADGWWLVPGADAAVYPTGFPTTALKCGVAADAACVDVLTAPASGYVIDDIPVDAQESYVLRVVGDDGQLHYGVIRVTLLGFDQADTPLMIFDWAYQLQPGNPALAPPRGG
jgi:hypothetical protein